ncbi:MAG: SLC13 family permease [Thermoanaerobaculales bacterium]|nr:SLC13 family permease [Thermoanaerobaculales bacterium]
MTVEAVFTLIVVGVMLVALVAELLAPDAVVFAGLGVLLLAGIVTPSEALVGFSNRGMLTVALLFVVAFGVQKSGTLEFLAERVMGRGKIGWSALLRLMLPVSALSAFLNNTPVVAMMIPAVREWAERRGVAPSKYLIPLSYAAILGGTCTLIGTSTNLVVNGMLQTEAGLSLGMFDLARVGIPAVIIGMIYILGVGFFILPDRKANHNVGNSQDYILEMRVQVNGPLVGRTIEEAGLRHLNSLYLSEIVRAGGAVAPVRPDERLEAGDRLQFVGVPEGVVQLKKISGLVPGEELDWKDIVPSDGPGRLLEAVVSRSSPMLGKTIKEGNFRGRYDAAVLAVRHHGTRIQAGIGGIRLRPGDTLLLLAGVDFEAIWRGTRDFYLISKAAELPVMDRKRGFLTLAPLALMVLLAATGLMEIFKAAVLAVLLLLIFGGVTVVEARRSLELNVLIVIAAALGISEALAKTGAAHFLGNELVGLVGAWGIIGLLAAVYLATSVLTEVITNNAAAALMFPITYSAALEAGHNPIPFVVAVAVAASASFATPIGYQTNLMVYGPGNYRFTDFLRVGLPMNIIIMITALIAIRFGWSF